VIRTLHRVRGASAIGATGPGERGPYGWYGAGEDDGDDGQDDEQQNAPSSSGASDHARSLGSPRSGGAQEGDRPDTD
jgi:hypothetical protein